MELSLREMAEAAVHFGHRTSRWNPKMKKYIYCARKGVHIFDLKKTAGFLNEALEFIERISVSGKKILFVSTKEQACHILNEIKNQTGMPIIVHKWTGGFLTNFQTLKKRIKYFKELKKKKETGELKKYTKKEQLKFEKEITALEEKFSGVEDMDELPDTLFVVDCVKDKLALKEAKKLNITTIGITDTNADPNLVDYIIPANDDAIKSLTYILGLVKQAIFKGKSGKKEDQHKKLVTV